MKFQNKKSEEISVYIENQEYIANTYVLRCFTVMLIVFTITFVLNLLDIFIIEKSLMLKAYVPVAVVFFTVLGVFRFVSDYSWIKKYLMLSGFVLVYTIAGVYITYHVVLVSLFPFLFATLYSSKRVIGFVYILMLISTAIVVYGGYFYGLCDANMALLTSTKLQEYVKDGNFLVTQINSNPYISLLIFFVLPRCLIYTAFVFVCNSIITIVSGSLEKAKLTTELEKAKVEAEKANHAKSRFLARMSHEIRTPINAVLGMNEMILRESKEEQIKKYASDVKESSAMLLNIINEILDSSKIESGKMELVFNNYEMGSLLNDLYNMISVKAREKKLELVFDIDPIIPNGYYGDDKRIKQILINLLTNAVKYTERGTIWLKLSCTIEGDNAILHYTVKDTGIGIKTEDVEKIYDEFQRIDISRNKYIEGTGLGMNIVQQFLKLMGSELQIQSEYEKGSEFSFSLSQRIVSAENLGDFRERICKAAQDTEYRTSYVAPAAKILVVDDYQMNLKVFKALLKQTRMQIFEAESGRQCLEMVRAEKFDMIFLDHMMPEMDGIETLHAIRSERLCDNVPIIMLTANAIVGDKEKYLKEGFDDFITKPIMPSRLDKMVLKYLSENLVSLESDEAEDNNVVEVCEPSVNRFGNAMLNRMCERLPEMDCGMGMTTCGGDEEFYLELLHDFIMLPIKDELTRYFKEGNYKNYCIRIHGFKNSAYSVGAKELGNLSYEMEKLTKEGLPTEIETLQVRLFAQFDKICEVYKAVTGI